MTVVKKKNRKQKELYVYYNDWTGEIISVGTTERDIPAPFIKTNCKESRSIVDGVTSDTDFVVSLDFGDDGRLVEKNDVLHLRKRENNLFLLPHQYITTRRARRWDIRVKVYTENNRFLIEFNPKILDRLVSIKVRQEVSLNRDAEFEFYVVRKDRPDYLIDIIRVDAADLISDGKLDFDISNIVRHTPLHEIDILTRRYFEHYYVEVVNDEYVDTSDQTKFVKHNNLWQFATKENVAHFTFEQRKNILKLVTNVTISELNELEFFVRTMPFYVVGDTPDELIGQFDVDVARLRMGDPEAFMIDFDINDVNIMYKNPRIKINKRNANELDTN